MEDSQFNALLHFLPFWMRRDKRRMFETIENIDVSGLSETQRILLFNCVSNLNISRLTKKLVDKIWKNASIFCKTNICRELSFVLAESDVEYLKSRCLEIISSGTEDAAVKLCLLETALLRGKYRSVSPVILDMLCTICFENVTDINIKLKCLERVSNFRKLKEEELSFLRSIIGEPGRRGKVLDIFLKDDGDSFKFAIDAIIKDISTENIPNVHFFKLHEEFKTRVKAFVETSSDIAQITQDILIFVRTFLSDLFEKSRLLETFISLLLLSGFKFDGIDVNILVAYSWSLLDIVAKSDLLLEMNSMKLDDMCYSGIVANFLIEISILTNVETLVVNELFATRTAALEKMKEKYSPNDDIWVNPEKVERELDFNLLSLKNGDQGH